MESKQKAGEELHVFLALERCKCLQVEQMLVLVAPVCSRFSHPKETSCLSGRTINYQFRTFPQGKVRFLCPFLVRAQKLSKLVS